MKIINRDYVHTSESNINALKTAIANKPELSSVEARKINAEFAAMSEGELHQAALDAGLAVTV